MKYRIITAKEYEDLLLERAYDTLNRKRCHARRCWNKIFSNGILCRKHLEQSEKGFYIKLKEND